MVSSVYVLGHAVHADCCLVAFGFRAFATGLLPWHIYIHICVWFLLRVEGIPRNEISCIIINYSTVL